MRRGEASISPWKKRIRQFQVKKKKKKRGESKQNPNRTDVPNTPNARL